MSASAASTERDVVPGRYVRGAVVLAGAVLGVLAYDVQVDNLGSEPANAASTVAAAWAFLVAGLVAWRQRPGNRMAR